MELRAQPGWTTHASSSYFSSEHLAVSEEDELQLREQQRGWSSADAAPGAPDLGRGLGRTLGTPVGVGGDVGISGTADTSLHGIVCLNMKRLLILSVTNESMLFGFHWNCIS